MEFYPESTDNDVYEIEELLLSNFNGVADTHLIYAVVGREPIISVSFSSDSPPSTGDLAQYLRQQFNLSFFEIVTEPTSSSSDSSSVSIRDHFTDRSRTSSELDMFLVANLLPYSQSQQQEA